MTLVAARLANVKPSQTKAVAQVAADLKAQGRDITSLSLGEPDFDTPDNIIEAGIKAMRDGYTRYTLVPGMVPLREAIQQKLLRDNHLEYDLAQITVSTGAKQVLYNAMVASINPGDEVIVTTPCWVSYPDIVSLTGGTPVFVKTKRENGFILDAESFEAAITPRTKWLMLNSPCNPTGAVHQKKDLEALAEVMRRHPHVHLISDEVYENLSYGENVFDTMANVAPDLKDRCLVVNGLSKTYCMTGWRVGYGAGPADLIKAMNLIQSQSTSHATSISQVAAIEALNGPQEYLEGFRGEFETRLRYAVGRLNNIEGINCTMPQGAFYALPECKGLLGRTRPDGAVITTDIDLAKYFMEVAEVAVVPGTPFLAEGHFRISCATSMENLEKAFDKIEKACAELQ